MATSWQIFAVSKVKLYTVPKIGWKPTSFCPHYIKLANLCSVAATLHSVAHCCVLFTCSCRINIHLDSNSAQDKLDACHSSSRIIDSVLRRWTATCIQSDVLLSLFSLVYIQLNYAIKSRIWNSKTSCYIWTNTILLTRDPNDTKINPAGWYKSSVTGTMISWNNIGPWVNYISFILVWFNWCL
jgi:hypothetical protein